ncbi:MAG TPA: hypothetical protein VGK90_14155 [Rhizomicrobium sp.]|jgi:hypothetical protein
MTVIPCSKNKNLSGEINKFAEVLKTDAHNLGTHGLSEKDFYQGGLFRGAIERIRGQFTATMREKREFVKHVLNYMQDQGFIKEWISAGQANRYDYAVTLPNDRVAAIELKGCLDGNNTNIFERPAQANEFIMWSICTNTGADPRRNAWSGIHTRLSADIIERETVVDGLMIWDWFCGTIGRPCPKIEGQSERLTTVGPYSVTPPCIYLFPGTIPSVRNNPSPAPHQLAEVGILNAFHRCFKGDDAELNFVRFTIAHKGAETVRKTTIERGGIVQKDSEETAIRRR